MFECGAKVVCVDDAFPLGIRDIMNALPRKGAEYTVRDVVPGSGWGGREKDQQPSVYLVELVNQPNQHGVEPGFACRRFVDIEELSAFDSVECGEEFQNALRPEEPKYDRRNSSA